VHRLVDGKPAQQPVEIVEIRRGKRRLERRARGPSHSRLRAGALFPRLRELAVDPRAEMGGGADRRASLVQPGERHDAVVVQYRT
jgi:hypothetical protein